MAKEGMAKGEGGGRAKLDGKKGKGVEKRTGGKDEGRRNGWDEK